MSNERPRTYTERVSVPFTPGQREAFREYAEEHATAMSIVMREAALVLIGREDLSLNDETQIAMDGMIQRQPYTKPRGRHGARCVVNLTVEQRKALADYAAKKAVPVSSLLRDAGLKRIGLKPAKALALGRPLGSRAGEAPAPAARAKPASRALRAKQA